MLRKSDVPVILECIKYSAMEAVTDRSRRELWRLYFTVAEEFKFDTGMSKKKSNLDWKFLALLGVGLIVALGMLLPSKRGAFLPHPLAL